MQRRKSYFQLASTVATIWVRRTSSMFITACRIAVLVLHALTCPMSYHQIRSQIPSTGRYDRMGFS